MTNSVFDDEVVEVLPVAIPRRDNAARECRHGAEDDFVVHAIVPPPRDRMLVEMTPGAKLPVPHRPIKPVLVAARAEANAETEELSSMLTRRALPDSVGK